MNVFNKAILSIAKSNLTRRMVAKYFSRHWEKVCEHYRLSKKSTSKPRLFWGTSALINNSYWSAAMKQKGYSSTTLMHTYYSTINKREDFDLYFEDVVKNEYPKVPGFIKFYYPEYFVFDYILKNFDIVHTSCDGLTYGFSKVEEAVWLKKFGIKTVVIPYGSDMYSYSKLLNVSRRHGIQVNYPEEARREEEIDRNVNAWVKHCDIFMPAFQIDGIGRWDVLPCSFVTIDSNKIKAKTEYSSNDGRNGDVILLHAPNHRGAKGTDYVIYAVEKLQKEGLKVKLRLIEKMSNEELLKIMHTEVDIIVEELIGSFYGLFGIEAMATGLPLVTNMAFEEYTRFLRRFSYLNESPIVSATAENASEVLRVLVTNPKLRKELGIAGRQYAMKYHSETAAQFLFESIYDKVWYKKEIDLMNLYHPLKKESYNNKGGLIEHPLVENIIPEHFYKT